MLRALQTLRKGGREVKCWDGRRREVDSGEEEETELR